MNDDSSISFSFDPFNEQAAPISRVFSTQEFKKLFKSYNHPIIWVTLTCAFPENCEEFIECCREFNVNAFYAKYMYDSNYVSLKDASIIMKIKAETLVVPC
jgi:hypothetical protein